MRLAIL
jgi:uncharacterized peroxidase-related enzyme